MMDGWGYGMGGGAWTLMIVVWVALVALIGLAIVWRFPASRDDRPAERGAPERPSPERLVEERLARGEIDVETYERLRGTLAGRTPEA